MSTDINKSTNLLSPDLYERQNTTSYDVRYLQVLAWVRNPQVLAWFINLQVLAWVINQQVLAWVGNLKVLAWVINLQVLTWVRNLQVLAWVRNLCRSWPGLKISVRITGFIFNRFFKDYYIFNLNYEKRKILSKFIICGQGLGVIERPILDSKTY